MPCGSILLSKLKEASMENNESWMDLRKDPIELNVSTPDNRSKYRNRGRGCDASRAQCGLSVGSVWAQCGLSVGTVWLVSCHALPISRMSDRGGDVLGLNAPKYLG